MKNAYEEVKHAHNYDYVVVNDDLKDAASKLDCILTAEKCRIIRCSIDFENFREG
jgi:guanylate kinase